MKKINKLTTICLLIGSSITVGNAFSLFGWFGSSNDKKEETIEQPIKEDKVEKVSSIQESRYVYAQNSIPKNHIYLLDQDVSVTFGSDVVTINQAVNQLLENTGLKLSSNLDQYAQTMLANQLPATLRVIKHATLKQALLALTGENFQVVEDPISRIISFKIQSIPLAIYKNQKDEK